MAVLEVHNVDKSLGSLKVPDDVSFALQPCEALGVIGPNGAGKSTLFNLIGGNLRPDSGSVVIEGSEVTVFSPMARCVAGVGRSFQTRQPFEKLTVFENLVVAAAFGSKSREDELNGRWVDILRATGLLRRANTVSGRLTLLARKRLERACAGHRPQDLAAGRDRRRVDRGRMRVAGRDDPRRACPGRVDYLHRPCASCARSPECRRTRPISLAGVSVGVSPLMAFISAVAAIFALNQTSYRTALGRAFRASSDEPVTASLTGVRPNAVFATATGIDLVIVTIAASYLGMRANFDLSVGPARLIHAFEAVTIGVLASLWGTLAGGDGRDAPGLGLESGPVSVSAPAAAALSQNHLLAEEAGSGRTRSRFDVETDGRVIGTGPTGSATAALLATYGAEVMAINRHQWLANSPRAHDTNQRTKEVLRDLGREVEDEAMMHAVRQHLMGRNVIGASLAGEEIGRMRSWAADPEAEAEAELRRVRAQVFAQVLAR